MQTPAYWTGTQWIVHSVAPLSDDQLKRVAVWLLDVQKQRRVALKPGALRDDLDASMLALREHRIVCGLVPGYRDASGQQYDVLKATQGTGKIISIGG